MTTIFVTHDQEEAMVLSDRIAVLRDGVLQQYGVPIEIYKHPINLFVASFIGSPSMNFISGTLDFIEGKLIFSLGDHHLVFEAKVLQNVSHLNIKKRQSLLGIRPEDLIIHTNADAGYLPAEVFLIELLGSMSYINLLLGNKS